MSGTGAHRRGTSNSSARGGTAERRRRRAWIVKTFGVRSNVRPVCPPCNRETGNAARDGRAA